MRSGLFFLPFFSSGSCLHWRDELILQVWGFILAGAGQEGPKLWLRAGLCWHRARLAGLCRVLPTSQCPCREAFHLSRGRNTSCPQEWRQSFPPFPPQSMNTPAQAVTLQPTCPQGPVHGCQHSHKGKCCIQHLLKILVRKNTAQQIKSSPHGAQPGWEVMWAQSREEGEDSVWLNQLAEWFKCLLPACSAGPNPAPWSLQGYARGLCLPLGILQCHQASPTSSGKSQGCVWHRNDPLCPSGSSRDKLCSWALIPRSQGAVPQLASSLGLAAFPCVHLSGMVGRMGAGDTTFLRQVTGSSWDGPVPSPYQSLFSCKIGIAGSLISGLKCYPSQRWALYCL